MSASTSADLPSVWWPTTRIAGESKGFSKSCNMSSCIVYVYIAHVCMLMICLCWFDIALCFSTLRNSQQVATAPAAPPAAAKRCGAHTAARGPALPPPALPPAPARASAARCTPRRGARCCCGRAAAAAWLGVLSGEWVCERVRCCGRTATFFAGGGRRVPAPSGAAASASAGLTTVPNQGPNPDTWCIIQLRG